MTTRPCEPTKRTVRVRSVWRRKDPSGAAQTFEVTSFCKNPFGQRCAKGKTLGGKTITLSLVAMEDRADERFEHVHDDYVEKASA